MFTRQRIVSGVLAILLVFLLGGSSLMAAQQKTITINFWTHGVWLGITGKEAKGMKLDDPRRAKFTYEQWPKFMAEQFMKLYPNVKIITELLPGWTEGRQKLEISLMAGNPPDIVYDDSSVIMKYARRGFVEPINTYLTEEDKVDFYPWTLEASKIGDKYYFWPWLTGTRCIAVNRVIFEERGVENLLPKSEDRLWSYEELVKAAQATTFDRDGDGKIDVYGIGIQFKDGGGDYCRHIFLLGFGARIFDETGKIVLNSEAGVKGLQWLLDLQNKYKVIPPGSVGVGNKELRDLFFNGQVAMTTSGGSHSQVLLDRAIDQGTIKPGTIELYPVMYPYAPPGKPINPGGGGIDVYGVFKQTDNDKRDMAMEFGRFITNSVNQRYIEASGSLPTRESVHLYEGNFYAQVQQRFLKYIDVSQFGSPYYNDLRQFLTPMYQAVLTGQRTPREALDEAVKKCNDYIKAQEKK